ncbi:NifB/NifX family molybdenum-iron cluster-binding protein [Anaerosporobacter faecicola]|uniref:NifB/NifX family molybdenum-iron cluster-binding protein n=1 Tax=Anaerosporobacter faecicola TaxID=2718714 RepID=UPI001438858B|nr:NifB/NifX family molybdenum-iron cluster-binding protein [Anaerosporobacter faecicola]
MKIAVTYEAGQIFQHFGHTSQFKIYEVEDQEIKSSKIVDTNGSGHGALAGFLANEEVQVLVCGGIGGGAQAALAEQGIQLYGGVTGDADEAVKALLHDALAYNPNVSCNHHDHEHGGEGHTCGEHGCGSHHCGE